MTQPTHVEVHSGVLVCECGEQTSLIEAVNGGTLTGPIVARPVQACPACKKQWWVPATVDCELHDARVDPPAPVLQRATPSAADDWLDAARTMVADDTLSDDHRGVAGELLQVASLLQDADRLRAYDDGAEAERTVILVALRAALVSRTTNRPWIGRGLQAAIGIVKTRHENGGG